MARYQHRLKKRLASLGQVKHFVIDVDGVLTDGTFYYDATGKVLKKFGPHDADALRILENCYEISFISADLRGFEISKKRVADMGFSLSYVSSFDREERIYNLRQDGGVIFMADSFTDIPALKVASISICPANSTTDVKNICTYVCTAKGGNGAIAEVATFLNSLRQNRV